MLSRERDKLEKALGGIKDMGGTPGPDLRHRHQQGAAGDQGGEPPQHSGRRDPRHQLRSGRHHLSRFPAMTTPAAPSRSIAISIARAAIDGISRSQGARGVDIGAAEAPAVAEAAGRSVAAARPRRRPRISSCSPRRAARRTISPSCTGVGPQIVKKLNDAGMFHYWQIAAMTPTTPRRSIGDLKLSGRIARDDWVEQAQTRSIAAR